MEKIAFIIDGGYFTKAYKRAVGNFPSADNVDSYVQLIYQHIKRNLL